MPNTSSIRSTRCKKSVKDFACCFCTLMVLIVLSAVIPLFNHLFESIRTVTSKGDEILLLKDKKNDDERLSRLCTEFKVILKAGDLPDTRDVMVSAMAFEKRAVYEDYKTTYSFVESISLEVGQYTYLFYFLPTSSEVSVTSCGQTIDGTGVSYDMPVFADSSSMRRWLDDVGASEEVPCPSCVVAMATFPACPSTATFHFNTTGYPSRRWYFTLSESYQRGSETLDATLDLTFTKYLYNSSEAISNCTVTDGSRFCWLPAPAEYQVSVVLQHLIASGYPYSVETTVVCEKRESLSYILFFLVYPVSSALFAAFIYVIYRLWDPCPDFDLDEFCKENGCLCDDDDDDDPWARRNNQSLLCTCNQGERSGDSDHLAAHATEGRCARIDLNTDTSQLATDSTPRLLLYRRRSDDVGNMNEYLNSGGLEGGASDFQLTEIPGADPSTIRTQASDSDRLPTYAWSHLYPRSDRNPDLETGNSPSDTQTDSSRPRGVFEGSQEVSPPSYQSVTVPVSEGTDLPQSSPPQYDVALTM